MKQEDKKLLLKDICARLPYGVICSIFRVDDYGVGWRDEKLTGYLCYETAYEFYFGEITIDNDISKIKPYLRPMSSMTKEEKKKLLCTIVGKKDVKYFQVLSDGSIDNTDAEEQDLQNFSMHWLNFDIFNTTSYIDWLNAHHFDYRNLIELGLALPAPEGMYNV